MVRETRINIPGFIYHVINRGNNRQEVFKKEEDHKRYIELLGRYKERYGFKIYSYVLMNNHIHLLIEVGDKGSISKIMQGITLAHTRYYNLKYKASGHVWQGRFKSSIVGEERYLLAISRYIELNPVRARIVKDPGDYIWSSYTFHAYGKENPLIDEHIFYELLGKTLQERQREYREFVKEGIGDESLKEIRESVVSGRGYGSQDYLQKIEESIRMRLLRGRRGRPRKKNVQLIDNKG
ncbi:MAG: transposase [Nitrospirota bacterium]